MLWGPAGLGWGTVIGTVPGNSLWRFVVRTADWWGRSCCIHWGLSRHCVSCFNICSYHCVLIFRRVRSLPLHQCTSAQVHLLTRASAVLSVVRWDPLGLVRPGPSPCCWHWCGKTVSEVHWKAVQLSPFYFKASRLIIIMSYLVFVNILIRQH